MRLQCRCFEFCEIVNNTYFLEHLQTVAFNPASTEIMTFLQNCYFVIQSKAPCLNLGSI